MFLLVFSVCCCLCFCISLLLPPLPALTWVLKRPASASVLSSVTPAALSLLLLLPLLLRPVPNPKSLQQCIPQGSPRKCIKFGKAAVTRRKRLQYSQGFEAHRTSHETGSKYSFLRQQSSVRRFAAPPQGGQGFLGLQCTILHKMHVPHAPALPPHAISGQQKVHQKCIKNQTLKQKVCQSCPKSSPIGLPNEPRSAKVSKTKKSKRQARESIKQNTQIHAKNDGPNLKKQCDYFRMKGCIFDVLQPSAKSHENNLTMGRNTLPFGTLWVTFGSKIAIPNKSMETCVEQNMSHFFVGGGDNSNLIFQDGGGK